MTSEIGGNSAEQGQMDSKLQHKGFRWNIIENFHKVLNRSVNRCYWPTEGQVHEGKLGFVAVSRYSPKDENLIHC